MKTKMLSLGATLFLAGILLHASAQTTAQIQAPKTQVTSAAPSLNVLSTVSMQVIRHFIGTFNNATGVKWSVNDAGYVARFTNNDVQTTVTYNKKSDFEYMIRYYEEKKLAPELRSRVRSMYPDFNIFMVTEVTRKNKIAYVIKLQSDDTWKTIRLVEDEIEELEEYQKN